MEYKNIDWGKFNRAYPVNEELIWLNNCGTTPAGSFAIEEVTRYLTGYSHRGVFTDVQKYPSVKRNITGILAELLNCESSELALIHNTSEGINFISHGLDLHAGDKILLLENEYPSNVYPYEHWKEKDVELGFISLANTPFDFLENVINAISPNVRAISLSAVHWCTGMPLPLLEIGKICRDKNIELILDGAQGVGLVALDLRRIGISYMAFPAWKWLLGPLGLGVLYVSKEKLDSLKVIFKGQSSVVKDEEYLPYKSELRHGTDRFEYSTVSFTDWVYFQSTITMLHEIGFTNVMHRIYELSDILSSGLRNSGFRIHSDNFPGVKTGIVVADKSGIDSSELVTRLKRNNIVSALRLGRVRLAPHIYISEEQIQKVISVLSE